MSASRQDVAIIGMACAFPGAYTLDAFWRNIVGKHDAITDAPESWEIRRLFEAGSRSNDRIYCQRGGYLVDASFDPTSYGVLPRAAGAGEADQWLALDVASRALRDTGRELGPEHRKRTGVVLGKGNYVNRGNASVVQHGLVLEQMLDLLKQARPELTDTETAKIRTHLKSSLPSFDADSVSSLIPNITASRIANRLDLMGPTFTIDAACASSLIAIELASQYLASGQCDVVIAGGVHLAIPGPLFQVFCQLGALSATEQIRPYDTSADGTLAGDGVGMVVLKRLRDAQQDGDRVYAVIKGIGVASDGRGLSVMAPRADGERLALQRAYDAAGIPPQTVSLIEGHGTGTMVGDPTEVDALHSVFGPRGRALPWCALGTVKSMIGHLMPAAGIAGVIKTALALHHKMLPPTLHVTQPIEALARDNSAFYVNTETRPWVAAPSGDPRRAGVNAFGFGGINAHVVLEEAPVVPDAEFVTAHASRDTELCVFSAASRTELVQLLDAHAARPADGELSVIARSLSLASPLGACRLAIVASSTAELAQKIARAAARLADSSVRTIREPNGLFFFDSPPARAGKLAFVFPGEGSQYEHQLADLYHHYPSVRRWFDRANRAFAHHTDGALPGEFLFPSPLWSAAERAVTTRKLWSLEGAVASVLAANSALLDLVQSTGLRPDGILGHSTGELVALVAGGMIEINDEETADRYATELFAAYDEMPPSDEQSPSMLAAIGTDAMSVQSTLREVGGAVSVAMNNCSLQTVISGDRDAVERSIAAFQKKGVICERLEFNRPYHTPAFARFAAPLNLLLGKWIQRPAKVPTFSCATRDVFPADLSSIRRVAIEQWVSPVEFSDTLLAMYDQGYRTFVEIGARGNLSAFGDDILRGKPHLCIPVNVPNRTATAQLCHALGLIAAAGYELDLAPLFAHRPVQAATPGADAHGSMHRSARAVTLEFGFPRMSLPPDFIAPAMPAHEASNGHSPARLEMTATRTAPLDGPTPIELRPSGMPLPAHVEPAFASAQFGAPVMAAHLATMDQFLDVQSDIMSAYLAQAAPRVPGAAVVAPAHDERIGPLLSRVVSVQVGVSAVAIAEIDPTQHRYLKDHEFGRRISRHDDALGGVPVVPFTFSMEMLAEAASLVVPHLTVIGFRDLRGSRWIIPDPGSARLRLVASALSEDGETAVNVRIHFDDAHGDSSRPGQPAVFEGIVRFDRSYPPAPLATARPALPPGSRQFSSEEVYERFMFHGPSFRGIERAHDLGSSDLVAEVRISPRNEMLAGVESPEFLTDPVAIDVMGQAAGLWASARNPDRISFPFRIGRVDLYAAPLPVGALTDCRVHITNESEHHFAADIDLCLDGRVAVRCVDWTDRYFPIEARLESLMLDPGAIVLSDRWELGAQFSSSSVMMLDRSSLGSAVFATGGGVWIRVIAACTLGRGERAQFEAMSAFESRRLDWLTGRIAAKDSVREYLRAHGGPRVLPADIAIRNTPDGQPAVEFIGDTRAVAPPAISISHTGSVAVAIASAPGRRVGIDIEPLARVATMTPDFLRTVIHPLEDALVPEIEAMIWRLRVWCAKEAAAKACGVGLGSGLLRMRAVRLDQRTGSVHVQRDHDDHDSAVLEVFTTVASNHVVAICDLPA